MAKHPAAVALGRLGGLKTSAKKAASSRRNGRKAAKLRALTRYVQSTKGAK